MLILTITYKGNKVALLNDIYSVRELLENKNITIGIYEEVEKQFNIIKIFSPDEDITEKEINIIYTNFTEILYKFIMLEFYNKEIDEIINNNYFFLTEDEREEIKIKFVGIVIEYSDISDENEVYCINRVNEIKENILQVLKDSREINIDGYIMFRLKEIRKKVNLIMDKLTEKIMAEKEYNEFIKLLKYFVQMQDSKIKEVNIFISSKGEYSVQDEKGKDLMKSFKEKDDLGNIATNTSMEDLIISGLVTNSPKSVIVRGVDNCLNKEFINTIINVFEDRVKLYNKCK